MSEALGARHPKVRVLRSLARDARARREAGACLVEGPRAVGAAIERRARVTRLYCGPGAERAFADLVGLARGAGIPLHALKEGVLEKIGTTRTPQPVLAVAEWSPTALDDVAAAGVDGFLVVTDGVADPGNLGTILRSAEAAGAAGVVVGAGGVDVRNPKVVRASAGALFGLRVAEVADAAAAIDTLRARGLRCVGAVARGGTRPGAAGLGHGCAIVVGNEAHGISDPATTRLDGTVTLPMAGAAESLNVAMAATVLCFEAARQHAESTGEAGQ